MGIIAQRHWPVKFIRCLKYTEILSQAKSAVGRRSHRSLLAELKSGSSLPTVPGGVWLFTFSSGRWTKFSNWASAEATRILPLAWLQISSRIEKTSSCIITEGVWTVPTYPGEKRGLHHELIIKASSGCVFCASASYSPPMVSQPSEIIMTSKITSLCWRLWPKRDVTKSAFLLLDFFQDSAPWSSDHWMGDHAGCSCHSLMDKFPSCPLCLTWDSDTSSRGRKGKRKVLCVFTHQLGCAANGSLRVWDAVRLVGLWNGSCLILLSLMPQNRTGAQVTGENGGKVQGAELGKV